MARDDSPHDAVKLQLRDLRALERRRLERITDPVLGCALLESLYKLVVDAALHKDARAGAAALAMVEKDAKIDPRNRIIDISIIKNDIGALATKFQRDLLQVGTCGSLHDLATNDGAAGKGDLVDVHMRSKRSASRLAVAGEDVKDAGGEAGFFDELGSVEGGERGLLSRLEDNGATGGKGGANLPGKHDDGKIPGNDLTTHANLRI